MGVAAPPRSHDTRVRRRTCEAIGDVICTAMSATVASDDEEGDEHEDEDRLGDMGAASALPLED